MTAFAGKQSDEAFVCGVDVLVLYLCPHTWSTKTNFLLHTSLFPPLPVLPVVLPCLYHTIS